MDFVLLDLVLNLSLTNFIKGLQDLPLSIIEFVSIHDKRYSKDLWTKSFEQIIEINVDV